VSRCIKYSPESLKGAPSHESLRTTGLFAHFCCIANTWYAVACATWKRRREQRWNARTIYKEIEVLTICKICYFLSLPLPKLQKSKWLCSAGSVFVAYLYNFLGRDIREQSLHVASDFFRGGCCIHSTLYLKNVPPLWFLLPCCEIMATGLAVVNVTAISWVKFSSFGWHKTKNNWYTMFSMTGCPALQHSAHIFSAEPAYINALKIISFYSPIKTFSTVWTQVSSK